MSERQTLSLRAELDQILRDPIRGIRASGLRVEVSPPKLVALVERPALLRQLLNTLVAAASWGGGLRWLEVRADSRPLSASGCESLRLAVRSRREFLDAHLRAGWTGIEQVLLAEVRRAANLLGGADIVDRSDSDAFACEVRLHGVEAVGLERDRSNWMAVAGAQPEIGR